MAQLAHYRKKKPMPLLDLTRQKHYHEEYSMNPLGSGTSMSRAKSMMTASSSLDNRRQTVRRSTSTSPSRLLVTHHHLVSEHHYNTYLYHHDQQSPPVSPPPLSPTTAQPNWRDMVRSPTYQPASSLSSSSSVEEEDDDDEPLGLLIQKHIDCLSLLSDLSEDGDDDLVPIARLTVSRSSAHHLSAAEKYKAKVKAKLRMNSGN
ncbi:hypothetical protein BD560DRAFT_387438 [Blakeslea trispora]|nr:hypothetical protein BD560DRAFT_387438 [Blakeslea trispora]